MDEIQRVLIKAGHKNLAQKYYLKIATKMPVLYDEKIAKELVNMFKSDFDSKFITTYFNENPDLIEAEIPSFSIRVNVFDPKTRTRSPNHNINFYYNGKTKEFKFVIIIDGKKKKFEKTLKNDSELLNEYNQIKRLSDKFKSADPQIEDIKQSYKDAIVLIKKKIREFNTYQKREKGIVFSSWSDEIVPDPTNHGHNISAFELLQMAKDWGNTLKQKDFNPDKLIQMTPEMKEVLSD